MRDEFMVYGTGLYTIRMVPGLTYYSIVVNSTGEYLSGDGNFRHTLDDKNGCLVGMWTNQNTATKFAERHLEAIKIRAIKQKINNLFVEHGYQTSDDFVNKILKIFA